MFIGMQATSVLSFSHLRAGYGADSMSCKPMNQSIAHESLQCKQRHATRVWLGMPRGRQQSIDPHLQALGPLHAQPGQPSVRRGVGHVAHTKSLEHNAPNTTVCQVAICLSWITARHDGNADDRCIQLEAGPV